MPNSEHIIGLPYFQILKTVRQMRYLEISVKYTGSLNCAYCKGINLRKKDTFTRRLRHISIGERLSILIIKSHKYKCLDCGKYFNQRFPGIMKRRRSTEVFRRETYQKHHYGINQKSLSKILHIGEASIERCYQTHLKLSEKKQDRTCWPRVLGIDEHFFSRKKGYATTFVDLKKRKVFDVQPISGLEAVYDFKQNFMKLILLKTLKKVACKKYVPIFLQKINQLRRSNFPSLQALGETLNSWKEEIVRMWRFSKNNSITEGLYNKMEVISRRAYGFRNFKNYQLRVRVICGYNPS